VKGAFLRWPVFLAALAAQGATAHHGTSQYDMEREVVLSGIVTEWRFSNPHAWLYLEAIDSQGKQAAWTIESAPLGWLERNGWSATTLTPGERVVVKISPAHGTERVGIMREVTHASGETRVIRRPSLRL